MMRKTLVLSILVSALSLSTGFALAVDQEQIYGSHLMTQQERDQYSAQMRAAKTAEEREQIRMEHHERMKELANERGLSLPDELPARGGGMSPGGGMGPDGGGMGPGGGMGSGGNRGY